MKLVILIGNAAVGKMTVGQELAKITDLRLFHNHMSIELVIDVFGYYHPKTINRIRSVIFEDFAASNNYGMIFTYMWAFDMPSDWEYIEYVTNLFKSHGADIYYAELITSQEERLKRNVTENRLRHKASKQDIERSNERLLRDDSAYRCVSHEGEIPFDNYLRIDNTHLEPAEVASLIKTHFNL